MNKRTIYDILFHLLIFIVLLTNANIYPLLFLTLFILSFIELYIVGKEHLLLCSIIGLYIAVQLFLWIIIFPPYGSKVALWYFSTIWSYIIFSQIGNKICNRKLSLKLVQNKTWTGIIFGSVFSFITSVIYFEYFIKYDNKYHKIVSILMVIILIMHELVYSKTKQILSINNKDRTFVLDNFGYFISIIYVDIIFLVSKDLFSFIFRITYNLFM